MFILFRNSQSGTGCYEHTRPVPPLEYQEHYLQLSSKYLGKAFSLASVLEHDRNGINRKHHLRIHALELKENKNSTR